MAKFEQCPANAQRKVRLGEFCIDWMLERCDGCNIFTAYQMGRADAFKEALHKASKLDASKLDDDTWKEDMERDAQQYEADRGE